MRTPIEIDALAAGRCKGCHHCEEIKILRAVLATVGALQGGRSASLLSLVALRAAALSTVDTLGLTENEALIGADATLKRELDPAMHTKVMALLRRAHPPIPEEED